MSHIFGKNSPIFQSQNVKIIKKTNYYCDLQTKSIETNLPNFSISSEKLKQQIKTIIFNTLNYIVPKLIQTFYQSECI